MYRNSSSSVILRDPLNRRGKFKAAVAVVLSAFGLICVPEHGHAQSLFGTIAGDVTDSTQAVIAGAKVVAANPDSGFTRDTVTNSAGLYTVPDVPPGTYKVTVAASGFQTLTKTGIVVTVQSLSRVDVALTVGSSSESITVSGESTGLQTDRTDVRSELTGQVLNNAPVPIGRNYQALFITIPGVSQPQSGHSYGANPTRALAFTVNGGNINNNDTRVDGAGTRNFGASDTIQYIPAMEAIEAVSVATNSFDSRCGFRLPTRDIGQVRVEGSRGSSLSRSGRAGNTIRCLGAPIAALNSTIFHSASTRSAGWAGMRAIAALKYRSCFPPEPEWPCG